MSGHPMITLYLLYISASAQVWLPFKRRVRLSPALECTRVLYLHRLFTIVRAFTTACVLLGYHWWPSPLLSAEYDTEEYASHAGLSWFLGQWYDSQLADKICVIRREPVLPAHLESANAQQGGLPLPPQIQKPFRQSVNQWRVGSTRLPLC